MEDDELENTFVDDIIDFNSPVKFGLYLVILLTWIAYFTGYL